MKGKASGLVSIAVALVIAVLTRDGSLKAIAGSPVLTAFLMVAWFSFMGVVLYFWREHARRKALQFEMTQARVSVGASLRQLAQAVEPNKTVPVSESHVSTKEVFEEHRHVRK